MKKVKRIFIVPLAFMLAMTACSNVEISDSGTVGGNSSGSTGKLKVSSRSQLDSLIKAENKFCTSPSDTMNLNYIDVSGIKDMSGLFSGFNTKCAWVDIREWDVSNVTDMSYMFYGTDFNPIFSKWGEKNWDVSNVTDMSYMFVCATSFNGDLSNWDVSNVRDMVYMFNGATSFNGDLSNWDVSNVTDMSGMFSGASSFDGDISEWKFNPNCETCDSTSRNNP